MHARGTRHAEIEGQLAEEVAAAQVAEVLGRSLGPLEGAQAALLHDEQRPGGIVFANHELACFGLDGFEGLEHRHDRSLRQPREGRVHAEEVAEPACLGLQRECLATLGCSRVSG